MSPSSADWRPFADRKTLTARADLLQSIRQYFSEQGVLEVETPALSAMTITDPHLEPLQAGELFLQTSPEYAMKRLIAAGSGDIYQIARAFRADEAGNLHNPEFTLLEWYRLGFEPEDMYQEMARLMRLTLDVDGIDCVAYRKLFQDYLGIDVIHISHDELTIHLENHCPGLVLTDRDDLLTSLFSVCIEPNLGHERPCVVTNYPASQASLARLNPDDPTTAHRFELFYKGVELANGFHELTDPEEQLRRFEQDNEKRLAAGKVARQIDYRLIDALRHGMPDCTGVALGIDRLLMLKLGYTKIQDVLSFNITNA
jgi:lysyl-tRNA synthetase class 2